MSASISAEDIQKMITGNSTEKYIGEEGGHSPILDLVNRLSGQLNQQTAESNLYRGGAGYGGSFMNADQLAAREAGTKLNAKPYGGWGGYGSSNPTMTSGASTPGGGGAPSTYVPPVRGGGTQPVDPRNNPPTRYPGGGGSYEMPVEPPDPVAYQENVAPSVAAEWTAKDEQALLQAQNEYKARAQSQGKWTGQYPPDLTKEAILAKKSSQGGASVANAGAGGGAGGKLIADMMRSGIMDPSQGVSGVMSQEIENALRSGIPPATIMAHYQAVSQEFGPNFGTMAHGSLTRLDPELLRSGKQTAATLANGRGAADGLIPGNGTPPPGAPPPARRTGVPTGEESMSQSVTPEEAESFARGDGTRNHEPVIPIADGAPDPRDSHGQPVGTAPTRGGSGPLPPVNKPPLPPGGSTGASVNVNVNLPSGGKDWGGPHTTPPKGMQFGDTYIAPNGNRVAYTREGRYAVVTQSADGKWHYDYNSTSDNPVPELNQNPGERPHVGGRAIIGYTMGGQPIYNDNGMFEQGDNATGLGDTTPDAWNNSPDWRPEEPTGGLYGAYTELAGGNLTDYENQIGEKWRDLSENPSTPDDEAYKNLVAEYNRTPGKGIDEAYGAYDKMLKGNGYSDAEKGAMEGSAVRGLSEGFKQGADEIRRQGARTNNRAAAYAALGSGGAAYGASLGETNRQNQIKFADEAQRRQEVGASGMTNVAGLANTKAQFGIGAAGEYAKEMARRKEAGITGMGDFANYGRGLQSQGLKGLSDMLQQSNADKNNTYAQIAALLGTNVGQVSGGASNTKTSGWNAGVQF